MTKIIIINNDIINNQITFSLYDYLWRSFYDDQSIVFCH